MNYDESRAWLSIEGGSIPNGGSKRIICPFCGGGHGKESSFVIRNTDGQLHGNCWRGTCNRWAAAGEKRYSTGGNTKRQFLAREFWKETVTPPPKLLAWLKKTCDFNKEELTLEGLKYCPDNGRMIFPCYDVKGKQFGVNTKRTCVTKDPYPKWMTFFDTDTSRLHYPRGFKKNYRYAYIYVTEDIMSAVRIARFAPVVALQGTSMVWEQVRELHGQTDKLILALDPDKGGRDATQKIKKAYSSVFPGGIESRSLVCDPKSYGKDEMLKLELGE